MSLFHRVISLAGRSCHYSHRGPFPRVLFLSLCGLLKKGDAEEVNKLFVGPTGSEKGLEGERWGRKVCTGRDKGPGECPYALTMGLHPDIFFGNEETFVRV